MKKIERVRTKIENDKDIMKRINKEKHYGVDSLISDINTYIAAVKVGRIRYSVISVSKSGMSRTIEVTSCEKSPCGQYYYRSYQRMLKALGYKTNDNGTIRVMSCGMNISFATNYNLIRTFCRLGFISDTQFDKLSQAVN